MRRLDAHYFMEKALKEAEVALASGEVPVGAIVTCGDQIIAKAHNQTELLQDVTAHAEMLAITSAASHLGGKYLTNCTLYVTLAPCTMCLGALHLSQIKEVVYAANSDLYDTKGFDPKNLLGNKTLLTQGPLAKEAGDLLQRFFNSKRG